MHYENSPDEVLQGWKYARVFVDGKYINIGMWESKEAVDRYKSIVAELIARTEPTADDAEIMTVNEVMIRYLDHAARHYVKCGNRLS